MAFVCFKCSPFDSGGGLLETFVKGSPEMIKRRCTSSSLPPDYDAMVM